MKSSVSSESILINNKEYTLVGVSNSPNSFGLCDTTLHRDKGIRETFFIGNEALVNIVQRSINDPYSNKIISQVSTIDRCGDFPRRVSAAVEDYFYNNKPLTVSLQPLLDYIKSGLYVVYEADMIPTDGEGNYFWSSYMVGHEFGGSSTFNTVCRKERSIVPSFLVPTDNFGSFSDKLMKSASERVRRDKCAYGICFHLSGMFCALLSNHYDVTAALIQEKKIRCLVIEQIKYICTEEEIRSYQASASSDDDLTENPEEGQNKVNIADSEEITDNIESCLYSCCIKIPFSKVPNSLLERLFVTRKGLVGKYTDTVAYNCERPPHAKSKRSMPVNVLDKCEKYPDFEMLQSAALVGHLSDDELNALLIGETTLNGKYIINRNYYSSITIALNYLQYKDFNRFIGFVSSLLKNEDLTAVHQYAASRLQTIMDQRIEALFKEILNSDSQSYNMLKPSAEKYIKRYKAYCDSVEAAKEKAESRKRLNSGSLKRDISNELDSLEVSHKR